MAVTDYTQLETWQRAMELADAVYQVTRTYPKEETYGLTSQTRRSAVSVPSNIAEGQGRGERSLSLIEQSWTVGRLINGLIRAVAPPEESR